MGWNGWDDETGWGDADTGVVDTEGVMGQGGAIWDYGPIAGSLANLSIPGLTGGDPGVTYTGALGGAAMAMVGRISPMVMGAIVKLSQRLGGASGSVVGYGKRVWGQLSGWASKNPGVSVLSMLVSLGLTAEEAAHFIAWGATTKKRRRARGITGRDVKTTRRTLRKFASMQHLISAACHRAAPIHRRRK